MEESNRNDIQTQKRSSTAPFCSIAPCRLCLFGEHQDYLNLPVIALSLPLYCRIHVTVTVTPTTNNRTIRLDIPQIPNNKSIAYDLNALPPINYDVPDFALAALHHAVDDGWEFPSERGAICVSTSDAPMRAGISTSSAFVVAWVQTLAILAGKGKLTPVELAQRAHRAEVTAFRHPGGTMDHITSAYGGLLRIGPGHNNFHDAVEILPNCSDFTWVLADSGQPKDTMRHLKRCKHARISLLQKLNGDWENPNHVQLTEEEETLRQATVINRDTEIRAYQKWTSTTDLSVFSGRELGQWMTQHHEALRDGLHLSTEILEAMKDASIQAGAYGFKLVGSGGGGCGVAWCTPHNASRVADAMKQAGATETWIIHGPSNGAHVEY
jgi:galactokinase